MALAASDNPRSAYVAKYSKLAVSEMERTGVPASITLAQGILESNAGQSNLAVKGNNHFGIKCHNDWSGKKMKHDDDKAGECFRVYPSAEASFKDHSDFLRSKDRYKSLFDLDPADYKGWAYGLKRAGYATAPNYATKLIELIEDLELQRFDKNITVEIEAPSKIETPVEISVEQRKAAGFSESISISMSRKIYQQNGVPFVYSIDGESYSSLARSFGLFQKEILAFNELSREEELEPGTRVYLARKKSSAAKGITKYVVGQDGETLREISQRFGVRLSALRKMNILLTVQESLQEGDTVILGK